MRSESLMRKFMHYARTYAGTKIQVQRLNDRILAWFDVRTTKARASSIVTRLELMAAELGKNFMVEKQLSSEVPRHRESLATWRIVISLPHRRPHAG